MSKGFTVTDKRFSAEGGDGTSTEPPAPQYPTYVEQLRAQLGEKEQQLQEYIAAYKEQIVRGLEDTKQRLARENEREIARLRGRLVEDLLEVLDNLDRSLEAAQGNSPEVRALADGVRMVREQFAGKLAALGLSPIAAAGQRFDPAQHEAVGLTPVADPAQDGTVVRVVRTGYRFGEKVLRPAVVMVGKLAGTPTGTV